MVATGDATIAGSYATHTAYPQYYIGNNLYFGATETDGDRFTIDGSGGLIDQSGSVVGNFADTGANSGPNYVFVNPLSTIQTRGFTQVICAAAVNNDGMYGRETENSQLHPSTHDYPTEAPENPYVPLANLTSAYRHLPNHVLG